MKVPFLWYRFFEIISSHQSNHKQRRINMAKSVKKQSPSRERLIKVLDRKAVDALDLKEAIENGIYSKSVRVVEPKLWEERYY